jgi:hypothetical protein
MARLRRRISRLALGWLLCQSAVMAVPILQTTTFLAVASELCTCPGGVGGTDCPMHHPHKTTESKTTVRNACAPLDAALLSLGTGMGVLPEPAALARDRTTILVAVSDSRSIVRPEPIDAPPPRA